MTSWPSYWWGVATPIAGYIFWRIAPWILALVIVLSTMVGRAAVDVSMLLPHRQRWLVGRWSRTTGVIQEVGKHARPWYFGQAEYIASMLGIGWVAGRTTRGPSRPILHHFFRWGWLPILEQFWYKIALPNVHMWSDQDARDRSESEREAREFWEGLRASQEQARGRAAEALGVEAVDALTEIGMHSGRLGLKPGVRQFVFLPQPDDMEHVPLAGHDGADHGYAMSFRSEAVGLWVMSGDGVTYFDQQVRGWRAPTGHPYIGRNAMDRLREARPDLFEVPA